MSKLVPEVDPAEQTRTAIGECPHCSRAVDAFQIDAQSRVDVIITLKPCGCASHSSDGHYKRFADLVKTSGTL